DKEQLSFDLPGEEGSFRGRLQNDRIAGHWIQPRSVAAGSRFATPVTLERKQPGRWRGTVTPLDDTVTLYLPIARGADGSYTTFLRNPDRNIGIFARFTRIALEGSVVKVYSRRRPEQPERLITDGQYDAELDRLSIDMHDSGGFFDFHRATPADEARYNARAKGAYAYRKPAAEDDGWAVASVEEVGISRADVTSFVKMLTESPMDSLNAADIHALLIARHGKLVVEEYFHGFHRNQPHDTRSAAKVLTSILAGAAHVPASTKVYATMGATTADPRAQALTLEHLLTMSSGLDCDDSNDQSPGNENTMQEQSAQPDWYRFTLALGMIRKPGEKAVYCSVNPNLAGGVIGKATGRYLPELFRETVAEPLQLRNYALFLQPLGEAYFGGGTRLTARDFLKLAQLMLDGGKWRGKQIVSAEWARNSVEPQFEMDGAGYGYLWWVTELPYKDRKVKAFFAGGNGGQLSMGIPELDLAIVFLGGNYGDGKTSLNTQRVLVPQYVLRAVQ
ncbi:MAG TPA: serine hydrolase, partial [Thermoanaerobaculia bacterium]